MNLRTEGCKGFEGATYFESSRLFARLSVCRIVRLDVWSFDRLAVGLCATGFHCLSLRSRVAYRLPLAAIRASLWLTHS